MMFNGPWTTWKDVDTINSEALWTEVMKSRFSDTMTNARKESVKLVKAKNVNASGDMSLLKPFNPKWIRSEYWEKTIDEVWKTNK